MIPYMANLTTFGILSQEPRFCWPPSKMAKGGQEMFKDGQENPKDYPNNPKVAKKESLRAREG